MVVDEFIDKMYQTKKKISSDSYVRSELQVKQLKEK